MERRIVNTLAPVYGGYALAREEDIGILFIRGALPGEKVEVKLAQRKKDYAFGDVLQILSPSPYRVDPPCVYFGDCGGCQIQHAAYPYQLDMKRWILEEAFRRIGRTDVFPAVAPPGAQFGYRYRGGFKTDGENVGFFAGRSRRIVPIVRCPLMVGRISMAMTALRGLGRFAPSVSEIHIATDGAQAVAWLPGVAYSAEIIERFGGFISGVHFEDRSWGRDSISLDLEGLAYVVSTSSFFQANWRMNGALVRRIIDFVKGLPPGGRLLDLYAGAGNFALPMASWFDEVVAVEEDVSSFADLRRNIRLNNLKNVRAVRSSVERYRIEGKFDVLVLDPPRSGLSVKALALVRAVEAKAICYISCNPTTLARDVSRLADRYNVGLLQMFDFFPNTHHVEALTILLLR
ncbi:MAG: class I SAM-dependent RNA methyltransferase [Syntrophorhabdaceae bacterium]|nr:class I SAM-dependent RNA methyltransferase [Syntrophorhabdaceae bacterium]